jgi:hypothetical protein
VQCAGSLFSFIIAGFSQSKVLAPAGAIAAIIKHKKIHDCLLINGYLFVLIVQLLNILVNNISCSGIIIVKIKGSETKISTLF